MESLKRKRTELRTTSAREHTEKKMMKTKERKEPAGGTRSSIEDTGKDDMRNEKSEGPAEDGIENREHDVKWTRITLT